MHPVYHGIRPLSIDDLAFDYRLEEAKKYWKIFIKVKFMMILIK